MAVVSARGIAEPSDPDGEPYPLFGMRVAALHGFRLTFLGSDHEISLIQVLAGGSSQDLAPTADLNPANIPDGRLDVLMQDASPSGEEFGYHVSHSTLQIPGARRYQIRDVGCVATCTRKIA